MPRFRSSILAALALPVLAHAITAVAPAGGGTPADPYEIATLANLYWLTQSPSAWDKAFIQTADIDAADSRNWDGGRGLQPIGNASTRFLGTYHGQGHVIRGLVIDRPGQRGVGLFGVVSGRGWIGRLGVVEASIRGGRHCGALVGYTDWMIDSAFSSGKVVCDGDYCGGLAGYIEGDVSFSHSSADVTGTVHVGGLAGITYGSSASNYATGDVVGSSGVGGLFGSSSPILRSYATGSVTGADAVGGLTGRVMTHYAVLHSNYAAGKIRTSSGSTNFVGGLAGSMSSSFSADPLTASYWDVEVSGISHGTQAGLDVPVLIGRNTSRMKDSASFIGFDFADTWEIRQHRTYPGLRGIDDAPFAFADTLRSGATFSLARLLSNDFDLETAQDNLVLHVDSLSAGTTDSVSVLHFAPTASQGDTLRVVYRVGEVNGVDTLWGNRARSVIVLENHAPALRAGLSVLEDSSATARTATDSDGDPLSFTLLVSPEHGTAIFGQDSLRYTPASDFEGPDSVRIAVTDGLLSDTGWIRISVLPVNDAPHFVIGVRHGIHRDAGAQSIAHWADSISAGPASEASQSVGFRVATDRPSLFAVPPALSPIGTLTFTPAGDSTGVAIVSVRLGDDGGAENGGLDSSVIATFAVEILPLETIAFELGGDSLHTYGDQAFGLSASVSGGGVVHFSSTDTAVAVIDGDSLRIRGAGRATLVASSAHADIARRSLRIVAKTLAVVADPVGKALGTSDPVLGYRVSGLVGRDTISGSLARASGEDAGTYAIGIGSLAAGPNYDIAFTGSVFTIEPDPTALSPRPVRATRGALSASLSQDFARAVTGAGPAAFGTREAGCDEESCLSVDIALPGPSRVKVAIYDRLGTPVTAWSGSFDVAALRRLGSQGRVRLWWNLRAQSGVAVAPGVYLWKIEASSENGQEIEQVLRTGVR